MAIPILMKKCIKKSTLIPMANCEPKLSLAIPEIRIPLAIIRLNKPITKELPIKTSFFRDNGKNEIVMSYRLGQVA